MTDHDHTIREAPNGSGFWRSRAGIALIVFLAIAAVLLGYEHRIHLFAGSFFPLALLFGCVVMHFFMHGSHGAGGHGGQGNAVTAGKGDQP